MTYTPHSHTISVLCRSLCVRCPTTTGSRDHRHSSVLFASDSNCYRLAGHGNETEICVRKYQLLLHNPTSELITWQYYCLSSQRLESKPFEGRSPGHQPPLWTRKGMYKQEELMSHPYQSSLWVAHKLLVQIIFKTNTSKLLHIYTETS